MYNIIIAFLIIFAAHYQLQHSRALQHVYDVASNNGHYSGPSSYDVKLGSRTRHS